MRGHAPEDRPSRLVGDQGIDIRRDLCEAAFEVALYVALNPLDRARGASLDPRAVSERLALELIGPCEVPLGERKHGLRATAQEDQRRLAELAGEPHTELEVGPRRADVTRLQLAEGAVRARLRDAFSVADPLTQLPQLGP